MSNHSEHQPDSGPTETSPDAPSRTTVVSSMPTPRVSARRRTMLLGAFGALALVGAGIIVVVRGDHIDVRALAGGGRAAAPIVPGPAATSDAPPATDVPNERPTEWTAQTAPPVADRPVDERTDEPDDEPDAAPAPAPEWAPSEIAVETTTGAASIEVTTPDGWAVTSIIDDDPNGIVTFEGDVIDFEADATFSGVEEFDYEACRVDECGWATVSIDVTVPPRSSRFVYRPQPLTPPAAAESASLDAGATVSVAVHGSGLDAAPTAALLRLTVADPAQSGEITIASGDETAEAVAYLTVDASERDVSRLVRVPVGASGNVDIWVGTGGVFAVDQVGVYVPTARSSDGRFVAVPEAPLGALITETDGRVLRVDPGTHPDIPEIGVGLAVVRIEANVGADGGQIVVGAESYGDADGQMMWPGWGEPRNAVSEMVVPIGRDGTFELEYLGGSDITVTALGYITDAAAPVSAAGLFVSVGPTPAESFDQPGRFPIVPVQSNGWTIGYHLG